jgi:hypothetical protein
MELLLGLPLLVLSVESTTDALLEAVEVSDLLSGVAWSSWDGG